MSILVMALVLASRPTPVLGGRLLISLPPGATVLPGADRTVAEVSAPGGDGRLVVVAEERFATASADFRAGVAADLSRGDIADASLDPTVLGGLAAVAVRPPLPVRPGDGNLLFAAYVASADGTVQVVAFYAFGVVRERAAAWEAAAEQIAGTLAAGQGGLHRAGDVLDIGERGARVWCDTTCVVRSVEDGYELRLVTELPHVAACTVDDVPTSARRGGWTRTHAGTAYRSAAIRAGLRVRCAADDADLLRTLERHADTLETDVAPFEPLRPTWTTWIEPVID